MAGRNTVDELNIQIKTEAKEAVSGLDALIASLNQLEQAARPAVTSLSAVANNIRGIRNATKNTSVGLKSTASGMRQIADAANKASSSIRRLNLEQLRMLTAKSPRVGGSALSQRLEMMQGVGDYTTQQRTQPIRRQPIRQTAPTVPDVTAPVNTNATAIDRLRGKLTKLGSGGSSSVKTLGGSFIQLRSSIFFAFFAINALIRGFQQTVLVATDFVETQNLFNVAMRNNRAEADAFVLSMQRAFGLDPERIMRYQATFFQIAESMGIANDSAYTLSETLTRLTFDIASLRNMELEKVFEKTQAVLTGQDKAIRSLGGSIQMTTLQEYALKLGIDEQVKSMTQAEKSLLRLYVFYRQSAIAQGDMSRTLMQPANLMRVLADQTSIAARAIGSLFIGALTKVLPYIIYVVRAIGQLAASIASFFGVDMSALAGSAGDVAVDFGGMSDDMSDTAGSADKTAKAMKKIRDYTLGIDELNVLRPQEDTTPSGGGAGGGGGNAMGDLESLVDKIKKEMDKLLDEPFTKLMEKVAKSIKEALGPIQPFIDALGKLWDALKPFIVNVWQGFVDFWKNTLIPLAQWTLNHVGVWLLERFTDALQWFNDHPETAKNIGAILASFTALRGLMMLGGVFKFLFGWIGKLFGFGSVITMLKNAMGVIPGLIAKLGPLAASAATTFALYFGLGLISFSLGLMIGNWLVENVKGLKPALEEAGSMLGDMFTDEVGKLDLTKGFKLLFRMVGEYWVGQFKQLGNNAVYWLNVIKGKIADALRPIGDWFVTVGRKISEAWSNVWGKLKGIASGAMRGIGNGVITMLNSVLRPIRLFLSGINLVIGAINKIPGVDLSRITLPATIPYLASGGSVSQGGMFIAGEAGPELIGSFGGNPNTVMPLENSGFVQAVGAAVYSAVVAAEQRTQSSVGDVIINLDGVAVGKGINRSMGKRGLSGNTIVSVS